LKAKAQMKAEYKDYNEHESLCVTEKINRQKNAYVIRRQFVWTARKMGSQI